MNTHRFALRSNRICTPEGEVSGTIVVHGEQIESVLPHGSDAYDRVAEIPCENLGNLVIAPGVIDAHVHVNEPGRTEWEGFETATKAAIAGGVTTIVDMPLNSDPVTVHAAALEAKRCAAAGKCWSDVGFHGGVVPGNADHVEGLIQAGVLGLKAFLCDSGLDEFPATTAADLRRVLPVLKRYEVPLLVHAELMDSSDSPLQDVRSYAEYLSSRPDRWECAAIDLLIRLCEEYKTPIHVVHLATATALEKITDAKCRGLPLSVETCPHYLNFAAERIADGDTRFKCAPPIRSESNRMQLAAALTSVVDTVGSDHSPCPSELKQLNAGDFKNAWGGISSIQLTLPALWTVARQSGVSLTRVAELLSQGPAELLGLEDRKGRLRPGLEADLCVWDPDEQWVVQAERLYHRHAVTPYDGKSLYGRVHRTYLRGKRVGPDIVATGQLISRTAG